MLVSSKFIENNNKAATIINVTVESLIRVLDT